MSLPAFGRLRLTGLIAVLSFGLTSLFAVLLPAPLEPLVPATFIFGFFILIPLVWLLGDSVPLVASGSDDEAPSATAERPIAELRDRYATGEIDEAEFERRLDRLLETEDLDERPVERALMSSRGRDEGAEREFESR